MKFPQKVRMVRKDFKKIASVLKYQSDLKETLAWNKNPFIFYKRIEPVADEFLCSFHNHADGGNYELEDIARIGAINGYRVMAVTNHRRDYQFEGNRVIYNKDFDIYLIRGMECRCEESIEHPKIKKRFSIRNLQYKPMEVHGEENDVIVVGYEGNMRDFQPFQETVKRAREQKALVIMTALGNKPSKGPSIEQVMPVLDCFDAIEVFDSNHLGYLAGYDVVAKHFAKKHNIAGIYANDAHTLNEIGCAGVGFRDEDFNFLDDPEQVINNPEILIEGIRNSLKTGKFTNYGYHLPWFSIVYPSKILSLLRDAIIRPFDKSTGSWIYSKNVNGS